MRLGNHRRGDVDAMHFLKMLGQCLRESARPTAEIKCSPVAQGHTKGRNPVQDSLNVLPAGFEELGLRPLAAFFPRLRQDRPEGVFDAKLIPGFLDLAPDSQGPLSGVALRADLLVN